ncbi:ABC transporter ATP-binding protein [Rhodalgimonas zhirmunskyi]|uniref:ABC transporter ATP-binding protein n=1 Tax=Rhodalgimonas zhirmunskyi TaxID=2964767 RepID=A0AAJ1U8Q9_9RHOB|nr:ABC transporter ATP-binding protein [Rhodoalgimonas zhirmunskyi]MDQ2093363.1 ABC transporter ATP-binding protein [Rhodoalgimonas zhirmunskyi]
MKSDASRQGREIRIEGIEKCWGETTALSGVDITVPAGSFTALLGPSGCGKSTLLRIVAGLEAPSSGRVRIGGEDMTQRPADKRNLSMVFQSYALFPHLSVADNITFGLRTRRVAKAARQARLERVAALLGLGPYLERKPSELSGGQQQRVALGRAVISERPVCLMDEPLSNLDAKLRHAMRTELRALQRSLGFTMLYVTHDQVEAITMADQVVLINEGRVEQAAPPHALYETPATSFAARFIGTPPMNILPATALGEIGARAEAEAGCALHFGIRPEALRPDPMGMLKMHVTGGEYHGADALVMGRIGGTEALVRVPGKTLPSGGAPMSLAVAPQDIHLFNAATGQRLDRPISAAQALASNDMAQATTVPDLNQI